MGPESNTTALEISEQSSEVKDKLPFLAQKVEARDDIEDTIRELDDRIQVQEKDIGKTEENIGAEETLLQQRHTELKGVENNIVSEQGEIAKKNGEIGKLGKEIQTNEGTINTLEGEKKKIQEDANNLEASGSPSSPDSSAKIKKIDDQISALKAENAKKAERIKELNALVLQHMENVKILSAKRDDYINNIIPTVEAEIARLRELKSSQETEKNNLITERNDDAQEVAVLDAEIEEEQKVISQMNERITRSHSLYAANVERERPGRENLFEQMSSEFIGVFA